uniref:hypothetical protein n=1 Tax=Paraburkholderia terrae TaxID=311230 RepID=UPI001C3F49F2
PKSPENGAFASASWLAPLNFPGLLLFDPSVQVKLDGMPTRSLLEGKPDAALYGSSARFRLASSN